MKHSILLLFFMASTVFAYSQKVKMSKEARGKYVNEEIVKEEPEEKNEMVVYAILRMESEPGSGYYQASIDESGREIPTKAAELNFPELTKLTRTRYSTKAEIDILNYLAQENWEVVTIIDDSDKKATRLKYYLRKTITI